MATSSLAGSPGRKYCRRERGWFLLLARGRAGREEGFRGLGMDFCQWPSPSAGCGSCQTLQEWWAVSVARVRACPDEAGTYPVVCLKRKNGLKGWGRQNKATGEKTEAS